MTKATATKVRPTVAVYRIRNTVNGHGYIGSTSNYDSRQKSHLAALRRGRHHSPALQFAFDKHGETSFVFELLEVAQNTDDLFVCEQKWMDQELPEYNCAKRAGPNFRLGTKASQEQCDRLSASLMGRVSPMLGKKFSEEHKHKIGQGNKGKGRPAGYYHTPKSIEKMKHASVGRIPRRSPVIQEKARQGLKDFHAAMSPEERIAWKSRRKKPGHTFRTTTCAVCESVFEYKANGRKAPVTCGEVCRSVKQRQNLAERRLADPGFAKRATETRWEKQRLQAA